MASKFMDVSINERSQSKNEDDQAFYIGERNKMTAKKDFKDESFMNDSLINETEHKKSN